MTDLAEPPWMAAERAAMPEAVRWTDEAHVQLAESMRSGYDHHAEVARMRERIDDPTAAEFKILEAMKPNPNRFVLHLHTVDSLRSVPPLEPLVAGLIDLGTLAVLHGAPKTYKTFLALDLALSVAAGNWWQGRAVTRRNVVYVAAEGQAGFVDRVDSWLTHNHSHNADGIRVETVPVNLFDDLEVGLFADAVAALNPGLIVFDTLARCATGADENSSRDMGRVVTHIDWLREQLGACVLAVHHDNRSGTNMRGSSALDGALDTSISVVRDDNYVTAKLEMAKHHSDGASWRFSPKPVGASVVLDRPQSGHGLSPAQYEMVEALGLAGAVAPVSTSVWMKACDGVSDRSFFRLKPDLVAQNLVAVVRSGRTDYCQLTANGKATLIAAIEGL